MFISDTVFYIHWWYHASLECVTEDPNCCIHHAYLVHLYIWFSPNWSNHSNLAHLYEIVVRSPLSNPPQWRRGSRLNYGSGDPGSIPGKHSPRVGPLMARMLKTSSDIPVPVLTNDDKTSSLLWRWVRGSRSKCRIWITVSSLYSWNIIECEDKPQSINKPYC